MTYTPSKFLSFETFIAEYGDNTRYELIDGELRDIAPMGTTKLLLGVLLGESMSKSSVVLKR